MDSSSSPARLQAPARSRGSSNASQRWGILRRALLARSSSRAPEGTSRDQHIKDGTINISRKASRGFNLIECHSLPISQLTKSLENSTDGNENDLGYQKDVCVYYKLPCGGSSKLNLVYRREDSLELNDMEASNRYNIDTTGLVCKFCSSKFFFSCCHMQCDSIYLQLYINSCVWSCILHFSDCCLLTLARCFFFVLLFAMKIGRLLCRKEMKTCAYCELWRFGHFAEYRYFHTVLSNKGN